MNVTFSRFAHASIAALMAGSLAACGGGSSGGVNVGGGGGGVNALCQSTQSPSDGFAMGTCAVPAKNVFLKPVVETVSVNGPDSYSITVKLPGELPGIEPTRLLTVGNKAPDVRTILGTLRGQAYEDPKSNVLTAPYVAVTDFFRAWDWQKSTADTPDLDLQYSNFGMWEHFAIPGNLSEGYYGTWFGRRSGTVQMDWPIGAVHSYKGYAVGVIGPKDENSPVRRRGFSATVTVFSLSNGYINDTQTTIDQFWSSYNQTGTIENMVIDQLDIQPLVLATDPGSASPGLMTGSISTHAGGAQASATGVFELNYLGQPGDFGGEIAGRLRFTTSNGGVAIAAFGAVRQQP